MKEISVLKADLAGFGQHNSDWVVLRQDDPEFWQVAKARVSEIREVEDPELYGSGTRFDFEGPYEGLNALRPGGGVADSESTWWVSTETHGGFVVEGLPVWQVENDFTSGGIWGETPEAAVEKAWERGATLLPGEFVPGTAEEGEDVFAFLDRSTRAYEAAQRLASA